jgi:iron complex outermembrane receptor protein
MENMVQGSPNSAVRQNTESTTPVYGLDIDATYRLPAGLEAEAHILFMDAKFPDGTSVNDSRISATVPSDNYKVDLSGNWLPRVSAMTLNLALSQLIFSSVGSFDWVLQSQTKTQSYMSVYNGEGKMLPPAEGTELPTSQTFKIAQITEQRLTDVVPAYTHFDIGAGWKHPDGRISISGYVNNVLNIAYTTSIISTAGLNLRFYNPPRTAGIRFRVQW